MDSLPAPPEHDIDSQQARRGHGVFRKPCRAPDDMPIVYEDRVVEHRGNRSIGYATGVFRVGR
jgi:hypothetical protein